MTAKRDSKRKPKKDERPKVKKETVKDLDPDSDANRVRGGQARGGGGGNCTYDYTGCTNVTE